MIDLDEDQINLFYMHFVGAALVTIGNNQVTA
jgi:hypothetical protein